MSPPAIREVSRFPVPPPVPFPEELCDIPTITTWQEQHRYIIANNIVTRPLSLWVSSLFATFFTVRLCYYHCRYRIITNTDRFSSRAAHPQCRWSWAGRNSPVDSARLHRRSRVQQRSSPTDTGGTRLCLSIN